MNTRKSRFLLLVNVLLVIAVAMLLAGCGLDKENYHYSQEPTFEVMYSQATDTSDVTIYLWVSNDGNKTLKMVTFKCYFLDEVNNTLDVKEETFTLDIAKESQKDCTLVFTEVQGKPQGINLTSVDATYGSMTFGAVLEGILDWVLAYWYIVLLIVFLVGLLIRLIISFCS